MATDEDLAFTCLRLYVKQALEQDKRLLSPEVEQTHGKFLNLPFKVWAQCDCSLFDITLAEWKSLGYQPDCQTMRCLGGSLLSTPLRQRLLGPSPADMNSLPLPFTRGKCKLGAEYAIGKLSEEKRLDEVVERNAYKGMVACALQWFMGKYLCDGHELISTFAEPGKSGLPDDKQIAIGVMREVLIVPRFGSMTRFWCIHAEMVREGGHLIGFHKGSSVPAQRVFDLFNELPAETAMFELLLELGFSQKHITHNFGFLCIDFE